MNVSPVRRSLPQPSTLAEDGPTTTTEASADPAAGASPPVSGRVPNAAAAGLTEMQCIAAAAGLATTAATAAGFLLGGPAGAAAGFEVGPTLGAILGGLRCASVVGHHGGGTAPAPSAASETSTTCTPPTGTAPERTDQGPLGPADRTLTPSGEQSEPATHGETSDARGNDWISSPGAAAFEPTAGPMAPFVRAIQG